MLPCASQPTSVGPVKRIGFVRLRCRALAGKVGQFFHRFGTTADRQHDAALRVELDHHVRPFVHNPDVVVLVDAHGVGEHETVQSLTDLANEDAVLVELKQACFAAARVHEHVTFGVRRDADGFAEIEIRRQFEEIRNRIVGNFRDVLRLGLALRRRGRARKRNNADGGERDKPFHKKASERMQSITKTAAGRPASSWAPRQRAKWDLPGLEKGLIAREQRDTVNHTRRTDQLVCGVAVEVEARARQCHLTRDRPDVYARERPYDRWRLEIDFDPAQLCELGDFPQHDRGDAPGIAAQQTPLRRFQRAFEGVEQDVRVKIEHARSFRSTRHPL